MNLISNTAIELSGVNRIFLAVIAIACLLTAKLLGDIEDLGIRKADVVDHLESMGLEDISVFPTTGDNCWTYNATKYWYTSPHRIAGMICLDLNE
jgi:hypothetical protein